MALVFAAPVWVFSAFVLFASFAIGMGLKCDESCGGSTWRHSDDAWQWNLVVAAGATAFVAGTTFVVALRKGRRALAALAFVIGVAVTVAAGSAVEPDWLDHVDRHPGAAALCLGVIASGLIAMLFAPSRTTD